MKHGRSRRILRVDLEHIISKQIKNEIMVDIVELLSMGQFKCSFLYQIGQMPPETIGQVSCFVILPTKGGSSKTHSDHVVINYWSLLDDLHNGFDGVKILPVDTLEKRIVYVYSGILYNSLECVLFQIPGFNEIFEIYKLSLTMQEAILSKRQTSFREALNLWRKKS